jgi:hypothetical protein
MADNERDYGQESIEILLQVMENQREDLVVILAGYKDRMDSFFASNPGMSSRIAHHIDFPDYALDELDDIGKLLLRAEGYTLTPEAKDTFREYLEHRKAQPRFANARSVRNAIERARLRHASRLMTTDQTVGCDELTTLTPEEFLGSRVFTDRPQRRQRLIPWCAAFGQLLPDPGVSQARATCPTEQEIHPDPQGQLPQLRGTVPLSQTSSTSSNGMRALTGWRTCVSRGSHGACASARAGAACSSFRSRSAGPVPG